MKNQSISLAKQLIPAGAPVKTILNDERDFLRISEFFYDTIQGEGVTAGCPAIFLRLQGCTLNCKWCDTRAVWRYGNPYSFIELFEMMKKSGVTDRLCNGHHLVLTGGSPLKQQDNLVRFLEVFNDLYCLPFVEIENECTIVPHPDLINYVSCWNNSPKLSTSGNKTNKRYYPEIIKLLSSLSNSWFKFVITNERDWEEVERDFLSKNLVQPSQVILMPEGDTREKLLRNYHLTVRLAIKHSVRCCSREQVLLWDQTTGI